MRFRLSDCLRRLQRHRVAQDQEQQKVLQEQQLQQEQQFVQQQEQLRQQLHADSMATCLNPKDSYLEWEAVQQQQQQMRTEQQQQQQRTSYSTVNSMNTPSASAPPASTKTEQPSTTHTNTNTNSSLMLTRAVSHKAYSIDPTGSPHGNGSVVSCTQYQNSVSESMLPPPHFTVFLWGLNDCGQLLSNKTSASQAEGHAEGSGRRGCAPASVAKLENKSICGCCLGLDRTWVWDSAQSVWGGGNNEGGCIDPEGEEIINRPRLSDAIRSAVCVAAGEGHTIAVLENGSAIAFGSNEFGQLARGPSACSLRSFALKAMQVDHSKPFLQGQIRLRQAVCGEGYSLVVSESGMLLACGQSSHGCLGLGDATEHPIEPLLIPVPALFALPIKQVAASGEHALALSISGEVFSWGSNKWGRLGLGEDFDKIKQISSPTLVRLSLRVRFVAAGDTHSGVVVSGGLLYLCGSNSYGELSFPVGPLSASRERLHRGSSERTPIAWSSRFLLVTALQQHKVKMAALGRHFSMALTRTGRVFSWGVNDVNQLGVCGDVVLPLSPSLGQEFPPPLPHSPDPQPLWLPPGGSAQQHPTEQQQQQQQLMFYMISAGAFTSFAAAVELPYGEAEAAAAAGALEGFFKKVLCRSRSSVGWEQRKLSASTSVLGGQGPSSVAVAGGVSSTGQKGGEVGCFQRLLTLSRGESIIFGFDLHGSPGLSFAGESSLTRQESSTQDKAAFFLAGVSVEEVLRLLEGARSTGDLSHLRLVASQVFSDVFRLNSSFAYPGHGSVPDFEGVNAVYAQLPAELLPLICQSFSCVVSATMKSAQHLKRPDQIKFILFILACTPIFSGFCEERQTASNEKHKDVEGGAAGMQQNEAAGGASDSRQQQQQKEDARGEMLYTAVIHMLFHLPPEGKRSFLRLAKEFPDTIFEKALVRTACCFLARAVQEAGNRYRIVDKVWHCAALLQLLYRANASSNRQVLIGMGGGTKIPIEKFQVEELGSIVNPIKEVGAYVDLVPRLGQEESHEETQQSKGPKSKRLRLFDLERDVIQSSELQSSWCLFIAHLNLCPLSFKRNVLVVDNIYNQHHVSLQSLLNTQLPFLIIRVRRNFLVEDSCKILGSCDPSDLLRPVKVVFDGEEGVDEGGLRREFFSLLTRELFSPSRGLFTYNTGVRTSWFQPYEKPSLEDKPTGDTPGAPVPKEQTAEQISADAGGETDDPKTTKGEEAPPTDKAKEYRFTGLLMSVAVYNDILMPVSLPLVVYKRLQGCDVSLEDLGDVFPDELNSFQKLLEIDDEATFNAAFEGMTFAVDVEQPGGNSLQVPLKPQGENLPLTLANREEFVDLYTRYLLVHSVEEQYKWFERGFNTVASPLLGSLTGRELQLLVCGTPELDFNELKTSCRYEGYEPDSPYIQSLWEILISFDIFQKQNFLKFVSGSDRAPAFGLNELHMVVQKNGAEPTERLPTAYTCFCTLLLPEYATKEKLQRLLTIAIEASEGFGLQ